MTFHRSLDDGDRIFSAINNLSAFGYGSCTLFHDPFYFDSSSAFTTLFYTASGCVLRSPYGHQLRSWLPTFGDAQSHRLPASATRMLRHYIFRIGLRL